MSEHEFRSGDAPYTCRICGRNIREHELNDEVRSYLEHLGSQERQAGGHVHERGDHLPWSELIECKRCDDIVADVSWWDGYEQGVADAAARRQ